MRKLLCLLVCLYPARWRERYRQEMAALIEDSVPQYSDVVDLLYGAIEMQAKSWTVAKTVVACGIAGLAVSLALAFNTPVRYVSEAVLERPAGGEDVLAAFGRVLHGDFRKLRPEITVVQRRDQKTLEVSFTAGDAARAHAANAALVQRLVDSGRFSVIEPPTQPELPVAPLYGLFAALGIGAGLVLGAAAGFFLRSRSPRVA